MSAIHDAADGAGVDNSGDKKRHCDLFFYAKTEVEYPCSSCCSLCCCLCLFFVVIILSAAAGATLITFTTDVPFYLYETDVYKKQSAFFSAFDVANARLGGESREREEQKEDFRLTVLYELEGEEALLSPEVLGRIQELEERIIAVAEYTSFCALTYGFDDANPICIRPDSPVNFFDPDWFVPIFSPLDEPTVPSTANLAVLIPDSKISGAVEDTYYIYGDPYDSSMESTAVLTDGNVDTITEYWRLYCGESAVCPAEANGDESPIAVVFEGANATVPDFFATVADARFGVYSSSEIGQDASALKTVFYFGSPLRKDDGTIYPTDTDGVEDMRLELGEFLFDEYHDMLGEDVKGIKVYWDGRLNGMEDEYTQFILSSDVLLLLPTFLFVLLYLIVQTRSVWLGGLGMLMIFGNFGPALLLYRLLTGWSYFGTLNALAVFIILGVGADDIFVFLDTWEHMRHHHSEDSVVDQLRRTLRKGGKAMAVTSTTTAFSFLANSISAFPAVQSFGVLATLLVISNFFAVIILYPAIAMVYEYYMHDPAKDGHCCRQTFQCCKPDKGYNEVDKDKAENEGGIIKFFRNRYYPFLRKFRVAILVIYALICVVYIAFAVQLEPDSEAPSLLPDEDQYKQVPDKIADYFAASDESSKLVAQIPFGIAGADRSDCDGSRCDPTVETDYGAPIWDQTVYNISDEYAQKWMLDFCAEMGSGNEEQLLVEPATAANPRPVRCPHDAFKTWCSTRGCNQTHPDLSTDDYVVDAVDFQATFIEFLESDVDITDPDFAPATTNYDIWQDFVRGEYSGEETATNVAAEDIIFRYIKVEAVLQANFDIEYTQGTSLYDDWKDFLAVWKEKAASAEYLATDAYQSGYVTDDGAFHYFFLQGQIIKEAFQGMGLSLVFAFFVLCVATGNWLVSSLAIFTITSMVGGVVAFTVWNGWKLGVLEAIIYVMVVGFSVDYTVHLSDAYLESEHAKRGERTQDMLATMGISVVSGAFSTLGASLPLFFAYIVFFSKFGSTMFFLIFQSLIFALLPFSAMLDLIGPQQPEYGKHIKKGVDVVVAGESADEGEMGRGYVTAVQGDTATVELRDTHGADTGPVTVSVDRVRKADPFGTITIFARAWRHIFRHVGAGKHSRGKPTASTLVAAAGDKHDGAVYNESPMHATTAT